MRQRLSLCKMALCRSVVKGLCLGVGRRGGDRTKRAALALPGASLVLCFWRKMLRKVVGIFAWRKVEGERRVVKFCSDRLRPSGTVWVSVEWRGRSCHPPNIQPFKQFTFSLDRLTQGAASFRMRSGCYIWVQIYFPLSPPRGSSKLCHVMSCMHF